MRSPRLQRMPAISTSRTCKAMLLTGVASFCLTGIAYSQSFTKNIFLKNVHFQVHSKRPSVVLIHGLDSSKDTWSTFMEELKKLDIDSVALDIRGHGESTLGDVKDFSITQIAKDIHHTVSQLQLTGPFVLLGHSMGGKVVMKYTSMFPQDVSALIIEDMHHRASKHEADYASEFEKRKNFIRSFPSFELLSKSLQEYGYSEDRIKDYRSTGRIFQKEDGSWWSNINPFAKLLAWKHVLKLDLRNDLENVIRSNIPVQVFYAKWENSVCDKDSIKEMENIGVKALQFKEAYHSIHNTQRKDMVHAVADIVNSINI